MIVVIVTYNSQPTLSQCLAALDAQSEPPEQVIIVDSGSTDTAYLEAAVGRSDTTVHKTDNIGFGAANNLGLSLVEPSVPIVAFINPDTFVEPDCLAVARQKLDQYQQAGCATGILMGYDSGRHASTGKIDSTGVFRTWYGRWYDRGQGAVMDGRYEAQAWVPAICGALMFCRTAALADSWPQVFDESFFLYKEDIDLSLRLRKQGWKLLYDPDIRAYHCRGWAPTRRKAPRAARLLSASNELKLTRKHRSPYIVWAVFKYLLVRFTNA